MSLYIYEEERIMVLLLGYSERRKRKSPFEKNKIHFEMILLLLLYRSKDLIKKTFE